VQFDDGHCMKIKTSWYLRFHKAKENLVFEKDVINLIMAAAARNLAAQIGLMRKQADGNRGAYAELVKANPDLPGPLKAMSFKLFQDDGAYTAAGLIRGYVASSTTSKSVVDEMRKIIPVQPW
jgi:hypothetical protein